MILEILLKYRNVVNLDNLSASTISKKVDKSTIIGYNFGLF